MLGEYQRQDTRTQAKYFVDEDMLISSMDTSIQMFDKSLPSMSGYYCVIRASDHMMAAEETSLKQHEGDLIIIRQ